MIKPAFLALSTLVVLSSCTNSMKEINEVTGKAQPQQDVGKDVTILYSKNAKVQARLFTHELINNSAASPPFVDMMGGLKVEFFDDSTHLRSTLTARYARWYNQQNNILLRDSVRIVTVDGKQLLTSELIWNSSIQEFFTEKPVTIITPTQTIHGKNGLEANQDFSWYEIRNTSGDVKVDKGEMPGG